MTRVRKAVVAVTLLAAFGFCEGSARGEFLDLAPPGRPPLFSTAVGQARSFIFEVNDLFALNSVGIRMDPLLASFNLRADLYLVLPGTLDRGMLLASSSVQSFTDGGLGFYDVAFATSLLPGLRYELEIQPPMGGFGFGQFNMEFYNYQGFPPQNPPDPPYTVGAFRVLDGAGSGDVGGPPNFVISHFRVEGEVVPEPSTVVLLSVGTAGLLGYGWRRRRQVP